MLIPLRNPLLVDRLIPLMEKIEGLPSIPRYLAYIKMAIPQDAALLLIDVDDDGGIHSFAFAESMNCIIDIECYINLAYYDPKNHKVGKEIEEIVTKWALMRGCEKIALVCDEKRVKAYIKKYGFDEKFIYLRKKITKEAVNARVTEPSKSDSRESALSTSAV